MVDQLIKLADTAGVRLGVLGGVSSVHLSEGGPRYFDVHQPPPEVRPEVETGLALLEALQQAPENLDWFYVSPAATFGAWNPQRVTGTYRVSDDVLLTDENGDSYIAAPTSPWPSWTRSSSRGTTGGASTSLSEPRLRTFAPLSRPCGSSNGRNVEERAQTRLKVRATPRRPGAPTRRRVTRWPR